jgi:mannose-1-phosphate guanylyltransferase
MITVIIAGGSGTRLWPLSTNAYPKHLLKVTSDDRSLLQMAYDRAKQCSSSIYVITEGSHSDFVKEQLPELSDDSFIIEPGRRNTASCVIAGLHHVQSRHDHDEPIAFLPADHFIRDVIGFTESFQRAADASQKYGREVLVGIEPTYPATGFGYIHKGALLDGEQFVHEVSTFKEKPELEIAQQFLRSGEYLWNGGYFVGSVNTFISAMDRFSPEMKKEYEDLLATTDEESYRETYLGFESIAIDYALNEKVDDLLVVPATFDWMDLGSFKDMHEANESNIEGNYIQGENVHAVEVENAYVRNDEDKPVAVIGLDNVVVVNTPHGILVARKDLSQKVGDIAKKVQS